MKYKAVGSEWLKQEYNLINYTITHCSYIGNKESIELTNKGNVEQVYGVKYAPSEDTPLQHIEFSLKYDNLNLDFLRAIFESLEASEIVGFIQVKPTGRYRRKIGFLYELLLGQNLPIENVVSGNYIDLLDKEKHITGNVVKNSRWRINNNLLGNSSFCPIVRKTRVLQQLLLENIAERIEKIRGNYPPEIFERATNYLYNKETRSSFEIEREEPSPEKIARFVDLLAKAGSEAQERFLDEPRLVELQNAIVDPRFAAKAFRDFQNYIGGILPDGRTNVDYICPPGGIVRGLMDGLKEVNFKTTGLHSGIRAGIIAFSFVFIHPFEDGNGRIHRFLVHDILAQDGHVPKGVIVPISAHMLNNRNKYDQILEKYSRPLMERIKYLQKDDGEIEMSNETKVDSYYRYPDLTDHCIYLLQVIQDSVFIDMFNELLFIQRYDEIKKAIQNIVDMPNKPLNLMIRVLHQNSGTFPKRKREIFNKLSDEEITRMQAAYKEIFEIE